MERTGIQGPSLPPLALVQLVRAAAHSRLFLPPLTGMTPVHVRPMTADEPMEKIMTAIDFVMLTTTITRFITALARFVRAVRRR